MANTIYLWDFRIMNDNVTESNSEAVEAVDNGAISYYYDDVKDNDGKVVLPDG